MKKPIFYTELAYLLGLPLLALGTALMSAGGFGVSMVVAPAYILHLKLSSTLPFFSFGTCEYILQAIVLILMICMLRKGKLSYLFTIVTAVIYGLLLDTAMSLMTLLPTKALAMQILYYCSGTLICAFAISLLLRSYLPPAAYELFVKELSQEYRLPIAKVKTAYDCCSCLVGIVLSLCFFQAFVGVKWGTIVCAFINGWLIGQVTRYLENHFIWKDAFALRSKLQ